MSRSMQDVVPREGRSIRNVSIERSHRRTVPAAKPVRAKKPAEDTMDTPPPPPKPPRTKEPRLHREPPERFKRMERRSRMSKWIGIVVILVLLALGGSMLFSGARVTVTVKEAPVVLETELSAALNAKSGLAYEAISVTRQKEDTVPATGSEKVQKRASGEIMIFNSFSANTQKLITNTRFESPDGLIYRIDRSVVVPGRTTDSNGKIIPGSITATVYADFPGEEYNTELVDFTVPGLKNDPREGKIFARSKTAITGGFSGTVNVASETDIEVARVAIRTVLIDELKNEIQAQLPEGFVLYDDALFTNFESIPVAEDSGDTVTVREQLTLHAAVFDAKKLGQYVAEQTIAEFDGGEVVIPNLSELTLTVKDKADATPWVDDGSFVFELTGTPRVVWTFDEEALRSDLAGVAKTDAPEVLEAYGGIDEAEIVVRPFWKSVLPDRVTRIKIKVNSEE